MIPNPIYEVNHKNPFYPWGFHFQIHFIKEAEGQTYVACNQADPDRVTNVVGIFEAGGSVLLNFRGRYTSVRDALGSLLFQALSALDYGRYDPYNNGIPLAAVNVMLIRLSDAEIRTLLNNADLLEDTMRQLAETVDKAISEAIQAAAEEVFVSNRTPDNPAAFELLEKGEGSLGVITMARRRAASNKRKEPKTPSDFLMWIEDETQALSAVQNDMEVNQYGNDLGLLALRLRSIGILPSPAAWFVTPLVARLGAQVTA
jgi:hypothetical protein